MKKVLFCVITLSLYGISFGQNVQQKADSLMNKGLLMPALQMYYADLQLEPSTEKHYKIASVYALLWTRQARDSAFHHLDIAIKSDSTLQVLYDPTFLSLLDDKRWEEIEKIQMDKYETAFEKIKNKTFALQLFRMIVRDQGFMYFGNIERKKYMQNGGYFSTPAIYPILAMEERNKIKNTELLLLLLDTYGWPTTSQVTEFAAAGAALIINHTNYAIRKKYFPMLEKAFKNGEAQALRYAKMKDRLLVEENKAQMYGTQLKFENNKRVVCPIENPQYVDKRRAKIGLGPLHSYLKERFGIDWYIEQKK